MNVEIITKKESTYFSIIQKPNQDIYKFVLNTNRLVPEETFFIDDTEENTITASTLGINVWNINPTCEDVVDLFSQKEFN